MAIKNSSAADVAVFWNNATKDVGLKGNCLVYNNLPVLNTSTFGNTLTLSSSSPRGGCIRVVASTNDNEASIGVYTFY